MSTFTFGSSSGAVSSSVLGSVPLVSSGAGALAYGASFWALTGKGAANGSRGNKSKRAKKAVVAEVNIPTNITLKNYKEFTFYDMLGVNEHQCDEATLKRAYHKAVLLYHPDKKHGNADFENEEGEEDRTVFLKIQEAYNTLGDEAKRRAYDSQLPFDERIPSDRKIDKSIEKGGDAYYTLWKPVFERNARFGVRKPAPDMGDSTSPIEDVYQFYDWWTKFESWRDFTGQDVEHDPESAEDREEKRWMIQENARIAKKKKKAEMQRINNFVMLAMKHDPRLVAEKNRKKNEKIAKEEASKRAKEEAVAAEAAAAEAAAANAKQSKADKDKLKKATSKQRNIMRKLFRAVQEATSAAGGEYGVVSESMMEIIQAKADLGTLTAMNELLGGEPATKGGPLNTDGMSGVLDIIAKLENGQDTGCPQVSPKATPTKVLSGAELTEAEPQPQAPFEREWNKALLSSLAKGVARFPAGTGHRWVAKVRENVIDTKTATASRVAVAVGGDWTREQQQALEKGLATYPGSGPKALPPAERWAKIGEVVPGRTAKECLQQYKDIRAKIQAAKK